jgi:hypothetical protein
MLGSSLLPTMIFCSLLGAWTPVPWAQVALASWRSRTCARWWCFPWLQFGSRGHLHQSDTGRGQWSWVRQGISQPTAMHLFPSCPPSSLRPVGHPPVPGVPPHSLRKPLREPPHPATTSRGMGNPLTSADMLSASARWLYGHKARQTSEAIVSRCHQGPAGLPLSCAARPSATPTALATPRGHAHRSSHPHFPLVVPLSPLWTEPRPVGGASSASPVSWANQGGGFLRGMNGWPTAGWKQYCHCDRLKPCLGDAGRSSQNGVSGKNKDGAIRQTLTNWRNVSLCRKRRMLY